MAKLTAPFLAFPVDTEHRSTTAQATLGSRGVDNAGNEYTYVLAQGTVAALAAVRTGTVANSILATSAAQQPVIGVNGSTAFASGEYGYVLTRGTGTALVVNSTAQGSSLVTGTVAGTLELADATDFTARGIVAVTSSGSSATAGATVNLL